MDEAAELPDHDYESIYGARAFYQRLCARIVAIEQRHAAWLREMDLAPGAHDQASLYTYAIRFDTDAQCFRATVAELPQLRARGLTPTGTLLAIIDTVAQHLRTEHAAGHTLPPPGHGL